MDKDTAVRIIEKVCGFDDETTQVGEAWAYIKELLECDDCKECVKGFCNCCTALGGE